MEQAEKFARENGLSLWDAIERMLDENQFGTRAQSAHGGVPQHDRGDFAVALSRRCRLNEALRSSKSAPATGRCWSRRTRRKREARLENLNELMNAAAEAVERGETRRAIFWITRRWSPHADAIDEALADHADDHPQRQGSGVSRGVHGGHGRRIVPAQPFAASERSAMEEERRLCYVGMTRARKRLILTWAKYRRRFGGGEQERIDRLRVPERSSVESDREPGRGRTNGPQVDLTAER